LPSTPTVLFEKVVATGSLFNVKTTAQPKLSIWKLP